MSFVYYSRQCRTFLWSPNYVILRDLRNPIYASSGEVALRRVPNVKYHLVMYSTT